VDAGEGGEARRRVGDVVGGVDEALVEATEQGQHQLGVGDPVADVAKGIVDVLHLLAVFGDGVYLESWNEIRG